MAHYRTSVQSTRSVEETFYYLADFSSTAEWDPGVADAHRLDDGPLGVGQRFLVNVKFGGRILPYEYAIIDFDPGHRVTLQAVTPLIRSTDTITVAPSSHGATVTYDARLQGRGVFALFSPLLQIVFNRIGERARHGLQNQLAK